MDHRDRLILALSALVRAEREARAAWEEATAAGAFSPEMAGAMKVDPTNVIDDDDIELAEAFVSPISHSYRARLA